MTCHIAFIEMQLRTQFAIVKRNINIFDTQLKQQQQQIQKGEEHKPQMTFSLTDFCVIYPAAITHCEYDHEMELNINVSWNNVIIGFIIIVVFVGDVIVKYSQVA